MIAGAALLSLLTGGHLAGAVWGGVLVLVLTFAVGWLAGVVAAGRGGAAPAPGAPADSNQSV